MQGLIAATMTVLMMGQPGGIEGHVEPASAPLQLERDQLVVEAMVGEAGPFRFVVDTGVSPSAIDLKAAREAGIEVGGFVGRAAGVGTEGGLDLFECTLNGLSLGGEIFDSLDAVALDMSGLSKTGLPVHGVLGENFFARRAIEIDYPGETMRLHADGAAVRASWAAAGIEVLDAPLEFRAGGLQPLIREATLNGAPAVFAIDTGSTLTLLVHQDAAGAMGLERIEGAEPRPVRGARGASEVFPLAIESITIGPFEVARDAYLAGDGFPALAAERETGSFGTGGLRAFVLLIDKPGERLTIRMGDA